MFTDAGGVLHFGSEYVMTDYTSDAHNIYVNATFLPMEKLRMTTTVSYNMSKGEMDQVTMPDITGRLDGNLSHQDFSFDEMHEYSNLEYSIIRLSASLEYLLAQGVTFTADVDYADLTDDQGYVYGDESGSMFMVRTGFRFEF
ncbi:MAG TPA: hypothetical protein ENH25_09030 [candidate division Zixibacteria bacterium]|nr:hypothetical protein [candidate division Zixibacteria bacterium]